MTNIKSLTNIKIVLLNTYHPGNIGAAARAMKTMGLSDLVLVSPLDYPSEEATSRAAGAKDLLAKAKVVNSLQDAVRDCTQVFATTARQKLHLSADQKSCNEASKWIASHPNEQIAIVFGGERSGISANEIRLCQQILYIPGNPDYDVLNMAAAVQIVCYEIKKEYSFLYEETPDCSDNLKTGKLPTLANQKELTGFYSQLEESLQHSGFINPEQPTDTMKRLRKLFARANPTSNEISMMRGVINALNR